MAQAYWAELMPKADLIATSAAREAPFCQQFARMRIYRDPDSGTVRSSAAAYVGALSSDLK